MGHAWREHPRVLVAQVAGFVVVVVVGIFIGMELKSDPEPKTPVAVQTRLDRAERQMRQDAADSKKAAVELKKAKQSAAGQARRVRSAQRRLRSAAARERRLRAALRRARQ